MSTSPTAQPRANALATITGASIDGRNFDDVRLSSDYRMYRSLDGRWRLAGPHDNVERIDVPSMVGAALEQLLAGYTDYHTAASDAGDRTLLDVALRAFAERGLLVITGFQSPARSALVHGRGSVATQLTEILCRAGHDVLRTDRIDLPDAQPADILITCAWELPDSLWQEVDHACARTETAWHRCHHETGTWVIGPLSLPGKTATYNDVRARRLAAARLPAELTALWSHLDDTHDQRIEQEIDPAVSAVVAGILAVDALAFLDNRPVPSLGHQLVLTPSSLTATHHRVLPLPPDLVPRRDITPTGNPE